MRIISNDNFFISGFDNLKNKERTFLNDYVIFDVSSSLFIIKEQHLTTMQPIDPVIVFSYCRQFSVTKRISVRSMLKCIRKIEESMKDKKPKFTLSYNEINVLRYSCHYLSTKAIGLSLKISPITVGNHKANALKKMGIETSATFYSEFFTWLPLWQLFLKEKQE